MKRQTLAWPIVVLLAVGSFCLISCSTLNSLAGSLVTAYTPSNKNKGISISNDEAIEAMKAALKIGISTASQNLSLSDGYFGNALLKILLPPEAKPLIDNLGKIPQGQKLIDDVVLRLNRAAESAAKDVVPIFTDAIMTMSVADGIAIIRGGNTAATDYLKTKTKSPLFRLYQPKVDAALARPLVGDLSAKRAWDILIASYNKVGKLANAGARLVGKAEPMPAINVDLASYATDKALDGLYLKISDEEKLIRNNPLQYASEIIRKVFDAAKHGLL